MLIGLGWTPDFSFEFRSAPCVFIVEPGLKKQKYVEHTFLGAEGESLRALLENLPCFSSEVAH